VIDESVIHELRGIVGEANLLTADEDLIAYGYDGTWFECRPLAVVLPETVKQVAAVHRLASSRRIALTPRALGSGLSGGSVPANGSIVLGVARLNRILEIDEANRVAVVESGVINATLQAEVESRGLFYPPDPSSMRQSAIGGNISENAGGARCLKYGVTGNYVAALQVVLPDGEILRTGGKMVKNATGYDLRSLFVGAEGTLGTITEATLRLLAKPKHALTLSAAFDRIENAARAVSAVIAEAPLPVSIELMDRLTMECVEAYMPSGLLVESDAMLLFAIDGNYEDIVRAELEVIAKIVEREGAGRVRVAATVEESARLWEARRRVSPALARRRPHKLGEDISVPRSRVVEMVQAVRAIAERYDLEIPLFGHAGDGNLHPNILCDRRNEQEIQRVRLAAKEIFEAAIALGGTLSGEHGIGLLKKQFLESALGPQAIDLMRGIKGVVDPLHLMNPGKIFPEPGGVDTFAL
jgi:glycolate oxidase